MNLPAETLPPRPAVHWAVRMNRRNRTVFYPLLLLAVGSHLLAIGAPAWTWGLLALNYLVFPQAAYAFAARAADPLRCEKYNMDADIVLFGFWSAALGFPLWIAFTLCAAGCLNMVVFHGPRGGWRLLAGLAAGTALAALFAPLSWRPETDLRTSVLCMLSMALYLFAFASDGFRRAMAQHEAHLQLREQFEEIRSLQAQLREQALRDPLTGLFNRRQLGAVLAQGRAGGAPLALLLIDIDHFKQINDTHGHAAGDAVLQATAQLLLRHARPGDVACRIGGEEFVLLLEGATGAQAVQRAQQLREDFAALRVAAGGAEVRATLSCGVACYPEHAARADALLACADRALYSAKDTGRNQVRTPAVAGA